MDHIKCAPSIFSHMKTFTPSPDASHAPVIGAEQAHEDARGAYCSADREWGLPQKSSLLEGFDFRTLRLILHFLRLTIVSRTLSEPLWSDSHIILFLSKYTFFICICRSQATIKTATERLYVLYLHTPISGAKPAPLCTVPDLVRGFKNPSRRLHLTTGFTCRTYMDDAITHALSPHF